MCVRECAVGEAESQAWLPVAAGPLSFTPPPPTPGPFLAAALFANTLSSSPWPPWLPAQRRATTQAGSCVALSLAPAPPQAPAAAAEVLSGWEAGGGRAPKDPFQLNSIQRPGDMGTCPGQSQGASWSRGRLENKTEGALGGGGSKSRTSCPLTCEQPKERGQECVPKKLEVAGAGWHEVGGSEEEQGGVEGANCSRQLGINWEEVIMASEGPQEQQEEGPRGGGH